MPIEQDLMNALEEGQDISPALLESANIDVNYQDISGPGSLFNLQMMVRRLNNEPDPETYLSSITFLSVL